MTTFSYLQSSKQFSEGCQEVKAFLQTLRATDGSGSNPAAAQGPTHAAGEGLLLLLQYPPDGCGLVGTGVSCHRVCYSSGDLPHILEACVIQLDSGRRLGTMWEHRQEHSHPDVPLEGLFWFFNFFPQISPPTKRKANTMPVSSRDISHTFSAAPDQGAKPV